MIHFDRFLNFCTLQLGTGDYDAHIPFLRGVVEVRELDTEEAVWLGLLYMAYYSEGSAWAAFSRVAVKDREVLPPDNLPITTQRRNLYGGRIRKHFHDLHEVRPSLVDWLGTARDWTSLLGVIGSVWGNGRWASYTTSELMTHLAGLDIEPSSYEILESSGPRKGLIALGLDPVEASAELVHRKLREGGLSLSLSQMESLLCDWAGMNKGTFYAGRNIDRQQGRILDVERKTGRTFPVLWEVRKLVFPPETLGELNGWVGIDKDRLKLYRTTGAVPAAHVDRKTKKGTR